MIYLHILVLSYSLNIFNGYDKKAFEDLFFLQKIVGLAKVYMNTHIDETFQVNERFQNFMV